MHRLGPLQDLPLERFLPSNPNLLFPTKSRPNKRSLSPAGPNLFSPTKRRILNEEGIFSPDMSIKSPIFERDASSRFARALNGPESPARKLDFGSPKCGPNSPTIHSNYVSMNEATPTRTLSSSSKLAPSPEFIPFSRSSSSKSGDDYDVDDYFSHPSSSSISSPLVPPTTLSREPPPPLDPQSVHYPGFRVHYDLHISINYFDDSSELIRPGDNKAKDSLKENIAPRRKPRKVITEPNMNSMSQTLLPDSKREEKVGKAKSMPATSGTNCGSSSQKVHNTLTPRKLVSRTTQLANGSTPKLTKKERTEMRELLHNEADEPDTEESIDTL